MIWLALGVGALVGVGVGLISAPITWWLIKRDLRRAARRAASC